MTVQSFISLICSSGLGGALPDPSKAGHEMAWRPSSLLQRSCYWTGNQPERQSCRDLRPPPSCPRNCHQWSCSGLISSSMSQLPGHNCIHFCQELALALGVSPVPATTSASAVKAACCMSDCQMRRHGCATCTRQANLAHGGHSFGVVLPGRQGPVSSNFRGRCLPSRACSSATDQRSWTLQACSS